MQTPQHPDVAIRVKCRDFQMQRPLHAVRPARVSGRQATTLSLAVTVKFCTILAQFDFACRDP